MFPSSYNNKFQILQGAGYVSIAVEMIHDVRIIPMDGRPHLPPRIRSWMGDSRGHWEGNPLVVDTTNFNDQVSFRGSDANLHLTERFTRVDANAGLPIHHRRSLRIRPALDGGDQSRQDRRVPFTNTPATKATMRYRACSREPVRRRKKLLCRGAEDTGTPACLGPGIEAFVRNRLALVPQQGRHRAGIQ